MNAALIAEKAEDWAPDQLADAILVDAPCSALGTLRRHPEGPWIKHPDDVARFPNTQKRLLDAALNMVKPGGRIIYCVCSPLGFEGEDVVAAALETDRCERLPIDPAHCKPFDNGLTTAGDLITLPAGAFAHDNFFISRLRRLR